MQLIIKISSNQEIALPINYHHIQQSAIYALAAESYGDKSELHDEGKKYLNRIYKLFTFGPLVGTYTVMKKTIIFHNGFQFEVRSADSAMIQNIERNVSRHGFRLGDITCHNVEVQKAEHVIDADQVRIKMISPICVYRTLNNGYTNYWNPAEEEFYDAVADNFRRKYSAAIESMQGSSIILEKVRVTARDKYFTKYKNTYIEAWKGEYYLYGKREYLNFLYNTGLGAKNSQGFGMFEVLQS